MWWSLAIWGLSLVVAWLTAPRIPKDKTQEPDLKEFNAPTAEQGRAIPVIFGKQKLTGSNVVWWGDLGANGDNYQAGIHQIYCLAPIDIITAIWDGDKKYTVSYTENTVAPASSVLDKVGSYQGDLFIEFGELNQDVNAYLDYYSANTSETTNPLYRQTGYIPTFRGFFGTIFGGNLYSTYTGVPADDTSLGLSPTPQSLSVELKRIMRQSDFSEQWFPAKAEIGSNGAMNAVHIIREAITSKEWGLGHSANLIGTSFQSYAVMAYNEGFGLGITLDRASIQAGDLIQQVQEYIDGFVYQDNNGLYQIKLARDNYDIDDLTTYDENDYTEIKDFTRGTPLNMTNQIALTYTDPTTWKKATVYVHDAAAFMKQGCIISSSISREWIMDVELAQKVAAKELRIATSQLAKMTISGNRNFGTLNPGDVFRINNSDLGLVGIVFRALKVDKGEYENNKVEIQCIEDVYAIGQGLYATPNSTTYDAALNDPLESTDYFVDEVPYWILQNEYSYAPTTDYGYIMTLQQKPSSECLFYEQWKYVGSAYVQYGDGYFAYHNSLMNDLGYVTEADIPLNDNIDSDIVTGAGVYIIVQNSDYTNYEIMELLSVDTTAMTMTVKRGCMDTVPQYHPAGSDVWFANMTANRGFIDAEFANGTNKVKLLNQTESGGVLLADTTEISKVLAKRYELPYRPRIVKVDSDLPDNYGIVVLNDSQDTVVTWNNSDRTDLVNFYDSYNTGATDNEAGQTTTIEFFEPEDNSLTTVINSTPIVIAAGLQTATYTAADEATDFSAVTDKWMKVYSNRSGYDSFQAWKIMVVRMFTPTISYVSPYIKVTAGGRSFLHKRIFYEVSYNWVEPADPTIDSRNLNTWHDTTISGSFTRLPPDQPPNQSLNPTYKVNYRAGKTWVKAIQIDMKTNSVSTIAEKRYLTPTINVTSSVPGTYAGFGLTWEGTYYTSADIVYYYTTDGSEPIDPNTGGGSDYTSGWLSFAPSVNTLWVKARTYKDGIYGETLAEYQGL